jgi:tRNA A37 threonylcarbamoyladenosine modification protein TsaB
LDVPVFGVCSLDAIGGQTRGEVLVITDARRREVYWARYRDGVRIDGPGVDAQADVPVGGAELVAFAQPTPAGLVAAVGNWEVEPLPLIPLYLRRPDAKTIAERGR